MVHIGKTVFEAVHIKLVYLLNLHWPLNQCVRPSIVAMIYFKWIKLVFFVFVKIPSLILKCLKVSKINQTKLNVIRIEKMSEFRYFFSMKIRIEIETHTDNSMWIVKETSRSFDYINFKRWFNGGIFIERLKNCLKLKHSLQPKCIH